MTILEHIKKELAEGYTEKQIRHSLLKAGWPDKDIDEAFVLVEDKSGNDSSHVVASKGDRKRLRPVVIVAITALVLLGSIFIYYLFFSPSSIETEQKESPILEESAAQDEKEESANEAPERSVNDDAESWELVAQTEKIGRSDYSPIRSIAFSPDGRYLVIGSNSGLHVYSTETWKLENHIGTAILRNVRSIAFSPNGNYLAAGTGHTGAHLLVFSTDNWSIEKELQHIEDNFTRTTSALEFSPDGRHLVAADRDSEGLGGDEEVIRRVNVYSTNDWSIEHSISVSEEDWLVRDIAFSPDGKFMAFGNSNSYIPINNVYVYSTEDWVLERTLEHTDSIKSIAFSPNQRFIAFGGSPCCGAGSNEPIHNNARTSVYSTEDWSIEKIFTETGEEAPGSITFSPDGRYLAYGASNIEERGTYSVFVYLTENWASEKAFTGLEDVISVVAFSPDSKFLAYGSGGGIVYVHKTPKTLLRE